MFWAVGNRLLGSFLAHARGPASPKKTCPQNEAHQKSPQHVPRVPGPRVQFPSIKQSYTLCAFLHNNYFVDVAQLLVIYN